MAVDAPTVAGPEAPAEAPARMGPDRPPLTTHDQAVASIAARRALPPTTEEVASAPAPEAEPQESQEESSEPITPEPTTPEREVAPEELRGDEAEDTALTESEANTTAEEVAEPEPITSIEELPDTVSGIAEAIGVDSDALLDHIKVPLPGTDQSITLREAQKGYLREATFTAKTTELADDRSRFNTEMQEQHRLVGDRLGELETVTSTVRNLMGEQPTAAQMAQLASEDPERYAQLDAQHKAVNAALGAAEVARQRAIADGQSERQIRNGEYLEKQQKLLVETMPELKDTKELEKFQNAMATVMRDVGYSDEEIVAYANAVNGPWDVRQMKLLKRAMRDLAAERAKPAVTEKLKSKSRVLKPGGSRGGKNSHATTISTLQSALRGASNRRSQESAAVNLIRLKRVGKA